jgi:medium-chain acyl-[acyl-carrier-protein] hydrolase
MGALLGFELAREMRRRGQAGPAHLYVSGSQAPQALRLPRLHDVPSSALVAALDALGGLDPIVVAEPSLWQIAERVVRGDLARCERYAYAHEPPLACALTALGGTEDPRVSPAELRAWRKQTTGAFALHLLEGGHLFVQSRQSEIMSIIAAQGKVTA